jgi:hypothetical protein
MIRSKIFNRLCPITLLRLGQQEKTMKQLLFILLFFSSAIAQGSISGTLYANDVKGFVITGVAELIPERIASIVYLDAFIPEGVCPGSSQ